MISTDVRTVLTATLLAVAVLASPGSAKAGAECLDASTFPVPESLKPNVKFWSHIYSKYSTDQEVIHDSERLDIVYTVLDFAWLERKSYSESHKRKVRRDSIRKAKHKYDGILAEMGGRSTAASVI